MILHRAAWFLGAAAAVARAQCGVPGPDLAVTDILAPVNYAASQGFDTLACGYALTNFGDAAAPCLAGGPDHPSVASGLYTVGVVDGVWVIRQAAVGWVQHEFFELSQGGACVCHPTDGAALGAGCTTTTSSATAGQPTPNKGPRWQADPRTGRAVFPRANPPLGLGSRRLAPAAADLAWAASVHARVFVELQVLAPGEPAANRGNNTSRRALALVVAGPEATLSLGGPTVVGSPAIEAWREADPTVAMARTTAESGGEVALAWSATEVEPGLWRYRYAVQNISAAGGFSAFRLAGPCGGGSPSAPMFSAPEYHGGDGVPRDPADPDRTARDVDRTPWAFAAGPGGPGWTCVFPGDPNANALRWGTLFMFGFDAPGPPAAREAELDPFGGGFPLRFRGVSGPPGPSADVNGDGFIDFFDSLAFVTCFEQGCPGADFNGDGFADFFDYDAFLAAFEAGC